MSIENENGNLAKPMLAVVKHSLLLKCYKNKNNLPYLAHYFSINGNMKYDFLYDVFNSENSTIIWNLTNKSKDEIMMFKKGILNRIKKVKLGLEEKIKEDEIMGNINNLPFWGQEKIDVFDFVTNTPKFRIYYR